MDKRAIGGLQSHITAANFCSGGKYAVVGTYDGRCIFFNTEERLKYHTQIHARSTRGKNKKGKKISGIEPGPGMSSDKVLVTSNDSRVRLYDLKDHSLKCKYRGMTNTSSQIKATFSPDGKTVVCGSEDHKFYTWTTEPQQPNTGSTFKKGWRRDRNDEYQQFSAHTAVVTVTLFAPPTSDEDAADADPAVTAGTEREHQREHILSADYSGQIKVFRTHLQPAEGAGASGGGAAAAGVSTTVGAGGAGPVQKSPV